MEFSKELLDSWNTLRHKMRKRDEVQEQMIKVKTALSFPTTGIIGAIAGDCFGAAYEFNPVKTTEFNLYASPMFTDDTVMTLAVAKWLMTDEYHSHESLVKIMKKFGHRYGGAGYGGNFMCWLFSEATLPYNSYGNGSAMRVSPCGFYAKTLDEALRLAKISAEVTHNHPEGIKGAQAIAACIFLARQGKSKKQMRDYIEAHFEGYNLHRTLDEIRPDYSFWEICQKSVPESIISYLEADSYTAAIRNAISLGGDADTMACMAGGIAIATKGMEMPEDLAFYIYNNVLDDYLRQVLDEFNQYLRDNERA